MAYTGHGDGYQVVWANGKWVIVTDTLAAADVVQYVFEEGAASSSSSSESSNDSSSSSSSSDSSSSSSESSSSDSSSSSSESSSSESSSSSSSSESSSSDSSSSSLSSSSSSDSSSESSSSLSEDSVEQGTVCWGHVTGVTQDHIRAFLTNWTGTGTITGASDAERLLLSTGKSLTSEIWRTGASEVQVTLNSYQTGNSPDTIEYRTGATYSACNVASWESYEGAFNSLSYVQIRLTMV